MLTERLFYCTYGISQDYSYLFYIPNDANYKGIISEEDMYKCYTKIFGSFYNISSVHDTGKKLEIKYLKYNVIYFPFFVFINTKTTSVNYLGYEYITNVMLKDKIKDLVSAGKDIISLPIKSILYVLSGNWDKAKEEWENAYRKLTYSFVDCSNNGIDYGIMVTSFKGTKPFLAVSKNKTLYIIIPQAFGYFEKEEKTLTIERK